MDSLKEQIRKRVRKAGGMIPMSTIHKEFAKHSDLHKVIQEMLDEEIISKGGRDWYYMTPHVTMSLIKALLAVSGN